MEVWVVATVARLIVLGIDTTKIHKQNISGDQDVSKNVIGLIVHACFCGVI